LQLSYYGSPLFKNIPQAFLSAPPRFPEQSDATDRLSPDAISAFSCSDPKDRYL
jgi:hypothetical protein